MVFLKQEMLVRSEPEKKTVGWFALNGGILGVFCRRIFLDYGKSAYPKKPTGRGWVNYGIYLKVEGVGGGGHGGAGGKRRCEPDICNSFHGKIEGFSTIGYGERNPTCIVWYRTKREKSSGNQIRLLTARLLLFIEENTAILGRDSGRRGKNWANGRELGG